MKPKFRQMAFETAVRNPERYLGVLSAVKDFEGQELNDESLLKIVSYLYLIGEFTSERINITKDSSIESIKQDVINVNSSRNGDGGFPKGYASRFWTYMRTLSEFGLVYARYKKPFKISIIAKQLLNNEIDEQEAFSIQAMKYNRKSPYRNVKNDFNFFRFALNVLIELRRKKTSLTFEQFIILMYSHTGNVEEFLELISNNRFRSYEDVIEFVKNKYGDNNKPKTITRDYPDVVRRIMTICGFITIRYRGIKFIEINENKVDYIQELLKIEFELTSEEKENAERYFEKLNSNNEQYFSLVLKYRKQDELDGKVYTNKLLEIINTYNLNEKLIIESIKQIEAKKTKIPEFQEIPPPLRLEFYISLLVAYIYRNKFFIRPNYKADHIGKPYSHAPGNLGDIDVYSSDIYWLIEVTLIRNKMQLLNNETTSLIRHLLTNEEFKNKKNKYLSLIAPIIHTDTKEFFDNSIIKYIVEGKLINIKTYNIEEFIKTTLSRKNLLDMEEYSKYFIKKIKSNL